MMNNQKIKKMVRFNVNKSIQNKWFTILNIALILITIVSTNLNNIKTFLENRNIRLFGAETIIEVVDNEDIGFEKIKEKFSEEEYIEVKKIEKNEYNSKTIGDDTVVVEIKSNEENIIKSTIISKEGIDGYLYDEIYSALSEARAELFAIQNEIEFEKLDIMNKELNIERIMLAVDNENAEKKQIINMITTFGIYMLSIFVFSTISNEIAQEKVSKSIEYVLTSVTSKEYLFAKITSTISVIFLQAVYMVLYYFIGLSINAMINIGQLDINTTEGMFEAFKNIDTDIIIYLITVFGYAIVSLILMTIIQVAISSKTTSMSEAQNSVYLLMMITIFAYFITLGVITPETNMSLPMYILACIPLLSNYMVPAILIIGQATPALIIVSLTLLLISIPIAFSICSKIFKNGVLNSNTKTNKKVKRNKELSLKEEQELKFKKAKYKKFSFAIGLALILYVVIQNLSFTIFGSIIVPFIKDIFTDTQIELIVQIVVSIVSLLAATFVINAYKDSNDKVEKIKLKTTQKLQIVSMGVFALVVLQLVLALITTMFNINNATNTIIFSEENDILTNVLTFVLVAVQAAIFEELLFRKAFIDYSKKWGTLFAVIISSIFFGLIHLNINQIIFAIPAGLLFGTVYALTGNISLSILLHFLNNGYAAVMNVYQDNLLIVNIINAIILVVAFFGLIFFMRLISKNKEKIKKDIKALKEIDLKECKYMFFDFSFILSIGTIIIITIYTEKILSLM